jgi:hypothetical protein
MLSSRVRTILLRLIPSDPILCPQGRECTYPPSSKRFPSVSCMLDAHAPAFSSGARYGPAHRVRAYIVQLYAVQLYAVEKGLDVGS